MSFLSRYWVICFSCNKSLVRFAIASLIFIPSPFGLETSTDLFLNRLRKSEPIVDFFRQ